MFKMFFIKKGMLGFYNMSCKDNKILFYLHFI